MINGKSDSKQPPIEINPEIKQIYMTGAMGGYTPHDFRLFIFNEKPKIEDSNYIELIRKVDHELIMSFQVVKELHDWLGERIKEFEKDVE